MSDTRDDSGKWSNPGVSGASGDDRVSRSQKIYEHVREALVNHRTVDASKVEVVVNGSTVSLGGSVDSPQGKKIVASMVQSLPDVERVQNNMSILKDQHSAGGPEGVTLNDLGIRNE
ncbi:MAG TPA: BON domain-containing protein [Bacteriovoracaceae bacterium]|nr:BON domain-containing protein [Bacteriovoracaceae bacterium]